VNRHERDKLSSLLHRKTDIPGPVIYNICTFDGRYLLFSWIPNDDLTRMMKMYQERFLAMVNLIQWSDTWPLLMLQLHTSPLMLNST
jgi:hypothetical protein